VLGYDIDPRNFKLAVNEDEAERVRQIFQLYLHHEALLPVVTELARRGWGNKRWTTRKGKERGGRPFDKCSLFNLLRNRVYVGMVRHKASVYRGEHEGIVESGKFEKVQAVLARNGRTGGATVRNKYNGLLKGLLFCRCCECSMGHSYTSKGGAVKYRYYVCQHANKHGWHTCPGPSVPANEVEQFVIERIKGIGRDPRLIEATVREAHREVSVQIKSLESERATLVREQRRLHSELRRATESAKPDMTSHVADVNERLRASENRLTDVRASLADLEGELVDEAEVTKALAEFNALWNALAPREQSQLVRAVIQRVEYDGRAGNVRIVFHPTGLRGLSERNTTQQEAA
jgi:site-specific DNA recombinase